MKKRISLVLFVSYLLVAGFGFMMGIYLLPIITAPAAPDQASLDLIVKNRDYVGAFARNRIGSDFLHWGEGEISITRDTIVFSGELAPGPDYRLYLSPEFVETESDFNRLKSSMIQVGAINTFENFIVPISNNVYPSQYMSLVVWCETFGQFITSGTYEKIE